MDNDSSQWAAGDSIRFRFEVPGDPRPNLGARSTSSAAPKLSQRQQIIIVTGVPSWMTFFVCQNRVSSFMQGAAVNYLLTTVHVNLGNQKLT
ncbi:hypothetical protein QN219_31675 [Sinorhizobium sp. 7-81]|uniref:hypothetical protein n=1 Tax=Sinorhizobium sp. 8-89 TaxID=3049089 RepID=UPI0024C22021|nr:hypothetical protein [Sinorhizobium sp. 8-89]MDK1494493.1 hypothetical protein [Sinorhizobium sp. 8-89]